MLVALGAIGADYAALWQKSPTEDMKAELRQVHGDDADILLHILQVPEEVSSFGVRTKVFTEFQRKFFEAADKLAERQGRAAPDGQVGYVVVSDHTADFDCVDAISQRAVYKCNGHKVLLRRDLTPPPHRVCFASLEAAGKQNSGISYQLVGGLRVVREAEPWPQGAISMRSASSSATSTSASSEHATATCAPGLGGCSTSASFCDDIARGAYASTRSRMGFAVRGASV